MITRHSVWSLQLRPSLSLALSAPTARKCASFTVSKLIKGVAARLEEGGVSEPRSSAERLISAVCNENNLDRFLATHQETVLDTCQISQLERFTACRLAHMPVQYIIGHWDFLDLKLSLRPPVFIPRPETEELCELVINYLKSRPSPASTKVLEVGCGSGAISLSLVKHIPGLKLICFDQSQLACQLTLENAEALKLASHLTVLQAKLTGDSHVDSTFLPEVNPDSVDVLVSNPPYVLRKDLKALAPDIKIYEDLRALDGGSDGLDVIECIIKWSSKVLKPGGKIFLETDPCHHILLPEMLEKLSNQIPYFKIQMESVTKDFSSKDRFITLIKGT